MWGTDVVFTAGTDKGSRTSSGSDAVEKGGITISCSSAALGRDDNYRFYSSKITITSSVGNITTIVFDNLTDKDGKGNNKITATGFSYSNKVGTWAGTPAATVELTPSAQIRCDKITVTYTPSASKTNTTLTLSPTSLDLSYGGSTGSLTATVTPEGESALASPTITWSSSNTSVATVSDGVVSPVGEGSCTITASYAGDEDYNESSNTATVTVTDARTAVVSAISSICSQKTLYIGGEIAFAPSVTLADGLSASDVTYSYVSADPTTIRINGNGTYTVLKTGTNIDITVTATPIAAKLATHKPVSATFQHNGAYRYSKPVFTPTGVTEGNFSGSMTLEMANDGTPTGPIYYTTDGTEPAVDKSNCTLYESSLTLTSTTTVKARVIDANGLYSTVTTATYTKVPANKDAITLGVGESLSFTDFSAAGSYWSSESKYLIASDGDKYKWTGTDVGNYSGKTLQIKNNTTSYITSVNVTSTNGFKMTLTYTGSVDVYVGSTKQTAADDGAFYFPTNTAITLKRGTSSTPQVSNITFTGLKQSVATNLAITDPGTLAKDAIGTFAYTVSTEESNTKAWTSNNTSAITITDASTGAYSASGRGTAKITLTLTPTDATNYESVSAERTVNVTAPVVITASDVSMTYGGAAKAIGATTSASYAGTLSYASGNTSVATVDATGKVTAVAVGSTTITISAPADAEHLYTAGEDKVINVTVNAPAGGEVAATNTLTADDYESLLSAATGWTYTNWTTSASYGACSTAGTAGTLKTKDYTIPEKANPCVFFEHTGKTFDDPSAACKLYVQEGDDTPVELTIPTYFVGDKYDNPYIESGDIDITAYRGKTVHFIFDYSPSTGNDGKWEVKNFGIYYDMFSVKLNGSGYATYCSEYPLDFTSASGYSAWQITDVDGDAITFSKVTGKVKGGTGLLLKGTANAIISIASEDSSTSLSDNLLVGTTAPTYVAADTYYGLSGNKFVKVKAGTVPAGKALLPASEVSDVKAFTFVFEDDADGINSLTPALSEGEGAIYNLAGQRIQKMQKGINIVNGKKIMK